MTAVSAPLVKEDLLGLNAVPQKGRSGEEGEMDTSFKQTLDAKADGHHETEVVRPDADAVQEGVEEQPLEGEEGQFDAEGVIEEEVLGDASLSVADEGALDPMVVVTNEGVISVAPVNLENEEIADVGDEGDVEDASLIGVDAVLEDGADEDALLGEEAPLDDDLREVSVAPVLQKKPAPAEDDVVVGEGDGDESVLHAERVAPVTAAPVAPKNTDTPQRAKAPSVPQPVQGKVLGVEHVVQTAPLASKETPSDAMPVDSHKGAPVFDISQPSGVKPASSGPTHLSALNMETIVHGPANVNASVSAAADATTLIQPTLSEHAVNKLWQDLDMHFNPKPLSNDFELTLSPPNTGKMHFSFEEVDGRLQGSIIIEDGEVYQQMRADASRLAEMLAKAGYENVRLEDLTFEHNPSFFGEMGHGENAFGQNLKKPGQGSSNALFEGDEGGDPLMDALHEEEMKRALKEGRTMIYA